jgi:hypothetical protein
MGRVEMTLDSADLTVRATSRSEVELVKPAHREYSSTGEEIAQLFIHQ